MNLSFAVGTRDDGYRVHERFPTLAAARAELANLLEGRSTPRPGAGRMNPDALGITLEVPTVAGWFGPDRSGSTLTGRSRCHVRDDDGGRFYTLCGLSTWASASSSTHSPIDRVTCPDCLYELVTRAHKGNRGPLDDELDAILEPPTEVRS